MRSSAAAEIGPMTTETCASGKMRPAMQREAMRFYSRLRPRTRIRWSASGHVTDPRPVRIMGAIQT